MTRRIKVILPCETLAALDWVAPRGRRSEFISQAVRHYVESVTKNALPDRLRREALANAGRDVAMAAEWFPVEEGIGKRQSKIRKRK